MGTRRRDARATIFYGARFNLFLQIRQRRHHARLQQHLGVTLAPPYHQRGAMIRTLEARASIAAGFHEPLLVGLLIVERALGQQLARRKRNPPEFHRLIPHVPPLADVMPPIAHLDDFKVIAAGLFLLFIVVAITTPSPT